MFQENPNNNSLSSILPCEQLLTAKSALTDVSSEIYDLVNKVMFFFFFFFFLFMLFFYWQLKLPFEPLNFFCFCRSTHIF